MAKDMNIQMTEFNGTDFDNLFPVGVSKYITITLTSNGWSGLTQTVSAPGVLADETKQAIISIPAIVNQADYNSAGIICTNQGANSLTYTAQKKPSTNLTVYVVLLNVGTID